MATGVAADVAAPLQQQQQETSTTNAVRKWTGSYRRESKLPIDKVWAVGGDFSSIHKWIAEVTACEITAGDPAQPGCLRNCKLADSELGSVSNLFLVEKLLVLNNEEHVLKYELLENFLGFKEYVATFKVDPGTTPLASAESDGGSGCIITWSMEVFPVEGKTEEEVVQYTLALYKSAVNGLEALASTL